MNTPTIPRLKQLLRKHRITHDQVAAEAGVTRTCVVHILSGRKKSANVVGAALRLLATKTGRAA